MSQVTSSVCVRIGDQNVQCRETPGQELANAAVNKALANYRMNHEIIVQIPPLHF